MSKKRKSNFVQKLRGKRKSQDCPAGELSLNREKRSRAKHELEDLEAIIPAGFWGCMSILPDAKRDDVLTELTKFVLRNRKLESDVAKVLWVCFNENLVDGIPKLIESGFVRVTKVKAKS